MAFLDINIINNNICSLQHRSYTHTYTDPPYKYCYLYKDQTENTQGAFISSFNVTVTGQQRGWHKG